MRKSTFLGASFVLGLASACSGSSKSASAPRATSSSSPPSSSSVSAPIARAPIACPPPPAGRLSVVPQGGLAGAVEFQISRDGRVAAARSTPLELQIWNVQTATKVGVVVSSAGITRFVIRPDGRAVAYIAEGRVAIADLERGTTAPVPLPGNDAVGLDWTTDGKLLFAARAAETVIVDANGAAVARIAASPTPNGVSPDGRWIFSREGALWDVRANQQRWKLPVAPRAAMFSEDGGTLAYAPGSDRVKGDAILVVEPATGSKRWDLTLAWSRNSEIAVSPDGQSVAAFQQGDKDQGMALFSRGKKVRLWQAHDAQAIRPAFSPDSKRLAFLGRHISEARLYDYEVKIADVANGSLVMAPYSKSNSLLLTGEIRLDIPRWSGDGRTLFQAGNGGIFVFDTTKGDRKIVGKGAAQTGITGPRDVAWSPDDAALLVVAEQGDRQSFRSVATLLDLKTGTLRDSIAARTDGRLEVVRRFGAVEWSEGIVALSRADGIVLWDGRAREALRVVDADGIENEGRLLALSPRGNVVATTTATMKEVRLWDSKTGAKIKFLPIEDGVVQAMAFSADGTKIAIAADIATATERNARILIHEVESGALVRSLHAPLRKPAFGRSTLYWTPQGRAIVSVDSMSNVELWNTSTDDPPLPLVEKPGMGMSAITPDGNHLVLGGTSLELWDLRTRTRERELPGDGGYVQRVRFNHAGTVAAVVRSDHVDLYRLADGAHLTLRATHSYQPNQAMLIHADNGLFSGSRDAFGQLRVRDAATPFEARSLRADEATALFRPSLAFDFVAGCPIAR